VSHIGWSAGLYAITDKLALKFRDAGKDSEDQTAVRRCGVHTLVDGYKLNPKRAEPLTGRLRNSGILFRCRSLTRQINGNSDGSFRHPGGGGNLLYSPFDHIAELYGGRFFDSWLWHRLKLKRCWVNLEFF
jgi:hypothetical protein